jgi:ATP-binding cassette subfamily A (ABC1) protein 3
LFIIRFPLVEAQK